MSIENLHTKFNSSYWLDEVDILKSLDIQLTKKEFSQIFQDIDKYISKNQNGRAINYLSLLLIANENLSIDKIKETGMFRASRSDFSNHHIISILDTLITYSPALSISRSNLDYFESARNIQELVPDIKKRFIYILKNLRRFEKNILKSLIAFIDYLFLIDHKATYSDSMNNIENFTKEELAEAVSYLTYIFESYIGLKDEHFYFIDEKLALKNPIFESILLNACIIKKYQTAEVLIDNFGYICKKEQNSLRIESPNSNLEKSIRLGFVHTEIHRQNIGFNILNLSPPPVALEDESRKFYQLLKSKLFEIKDFPVKRITMTFPKIPPILEFINSEKFFLEELMILAEANKEYFLRLVDLKSFCIKGSLTLFDLIRVHRLLNFIRLINNEYMQQYIDSDPTLILRSLLPTFTADGIAEILDICLDQEKIKNFLELLCWHPESNKVLDLQYQSILHTEKGYVIPLNVFSLSNYIRNILASERVRKFHEGTIDPLQDTLVEVLKNRFEYVSPNINYKFRSENKDGQIDVIAKDQSSLFIFECKNSLLPTNIFELRTSYDYVKKAAEQLDKTKAIFDDEQFRPLMGNILKWDLDGVKNIYTCIVTGNRMLYGYVINNHTVLPIHELKSFLETGTIFLFNKMFRIWHSNTFKLEELIKFIQDNPLQKTALDSMDGVSKSYKLNGKSMVFDTFELNINKMVTTLASRFEFIGNIR